MYIFGTSETPANFFSFNCGQVMEFSLYIWTMVLWWFIVYVHLCSPSAIFHYVMTTRII